MDTAKAVLNLEKSDLVKRSDLEEETIDGDHVLQVMQQFAPKNRK